MHTFEQFILQERQRGAKLGLVSRQPRQPKDQLYGHSAAKSFLDALRRSGEDLNNYGITMTELPKVGINPRSNYHTPIGVYFYPADYYYKQIDNGDKLPYQHLAPYINILKFKSSSNILHLTDDKKKYEKLWKKIITITKNEKRVMELRQSDDYREYSPAQAFFYGIMVLSRTEATFSNNALPSNRLLAKLGIDIVIDSEGKGIIHHMEPTQGFLIDGTKATVIQRISAYPPQRSNRKLTPEALLRVIMANPYYTPTDKDMAILASDGFVAHQYAFHTNKRFPEAEPAIIKDEKLNVKTIFAYFQRFAKGPFPAAVEDMIASEGGPILNGNYAESILKGPFPKGEHAIAQSAEMSFEYAKYVLKGRFIKGEPAIKTNDFYKKSYLALFGRISGS